MASYLRSLYPVTAINTKNGVATKSSRLAEMKAVWKPDKVRGAWVNFTTGGKFRKATPLLKVTRELQPGVGQTTISKFNGAPASVYTSGGGYRADIILSSNSGALRGGVGSLPSLDGTPVAPTSMRNEAVTKALLKIADSKAAIGEDLATFRQTLDLVKKPGWKLVTELTDLANDKNMRKFLFKSARQLARSKSLGEHAAAEYLKYVYGWKPLMQDIYGTMSFLQEMGKSKAFLLSGTGSASQQGQTAVNTIEDLSFNATSHHGPHEEKVNVKCKLWGRIDPNCTALLALNQLGLLNPLSLAWELVPWSFVVDWVIPIGSTLNALSAPAGLLFVDGSISVRTSLKGPYDHHYNVYDANATTNNYAGGEVLYEGYRRETLGNWPLAGFYINPKPFAGDRGLKALALAMTNLRGIR